MSRLTRRMTLSDLDCGGIVADLRPICGGAASNEDWPLFAFCASPVARTTPTGGSMRVLGIDPGLRNMGWGVIEVNGSRITHVANGICHGLGDALGPRLVSLYDQLRAVIDDHVPNAAAVENTFVNKDGAGTLKLGQARGIAMLVPAQAGLVVGEYAPNAVKKAIVGVGHADKAQIAHMVRLQLPGVVLAGADAADALAIAICHAHHLQSAGHLARAISRASA
jgi:crossover junction endodeoxyribonuclease RuvC